MDWLTKITNPLTERAKSPLYGAFLTSWVIWNWRIAITVIMPNQTERGKIGIVQFISDNYLNTYDCLTIPLLLALGYIFILPIIDFQLIGFTEEQKRKKIDKKLEVARKHKVDGNIYYDLKLEFEKEKEKIMNADTNEKLLKTSIVEQKNKISQNANEIIELHSRLRQAEESQFLSKNLYDKLNARKDISKGFNGRWKFTFNNKNTDKRGEEDVDISGTQYSIIINTVPKHAFDLKLIDFDIEAKRFSFVKYDKSPNCKHWITELRMIDNDRYEGTENEDTDVTYIRRKVVKENI